MDLYTLIGLGGVGFYVCSYALVQLGRMDGNGAAYSAMNVAAASMVLVSLLEDFNLPSMVTQITWIAVGVVGLLLRARRRLVNDSQNARAGAWAEEAWAEEAWAEEAWAENARAGAWAETEGVAAEQQPSSVPVERAMARAARPPVNPVRKVAAAEIATTGVGRVRPSRPAINSGTRQTLNLRPDVAPAQQTLGTLGLRPDVAPVR